MLTSFSSLKQLLVYAKPWRFKIYLATFYSVLNQLFDIAPEILIGVAVDLVVKKENSNIEPIYLKDISDVNMATDCSMNTTKMKKVIDDSTISHK